MKYSKKFENKVKRIANHYFRIIDTHKECTCCHKRLPKSEFRPIDKKSHIDGLYYMCYSCESKKGAKYTRSRRPVELLCFFSVDSRSEACKEELKIKKMKRDDKPIYVSKKGDINGNSNKR